MFGFNRPSLDVCGRTVLVTGAGSGIGAATARALHERGAALALVDVDEIAVKKIAVELGGDALAMSADVRDRAAMAAVVDRTVANFGRLDIVVANAGVAPPAATIRTVDADAFDRVLDINVTGVFNTVRPALEHVIERRGHVVVVASAAAFAPGAGGSPYMMSKAAVEQFGRALRIELAAVGASAGIAYFGVVETPMVRDNESDPLIKEITGLLPWPLSRRISQEHAARVIADAIANRSAQTIAPASWLPYSLLRGVANLLIDDHAAASKSMHELLRRVEARASA
ncbi:short-chain dehydrogenase/reductase [Nocardia sp. NPDC052001]|uniref:short-chain dehydrogenase/reductase n=1 Tax=Nocardia sp. NPDC052001 TaxID=3154853 RepID=UPI00342A1F14